MAPKKNAKKKASKSAQAKKATPIRQAIFGPCCSDSIDLIFQGTVFSAEINGNKFQDVKKISLTSLEKMTVFGLSRKGLFTDSKPWRVYIVKARPGQTLLFKDGEIVVEAKKRKSDKGK